MCQFELWIDLEILTKRFTSCPGSWPIFRVTTLGLVRVIDNLEIHVSALPAQQPKHCFTACLIARLQDTAQHTTVEKAGLGCEL